MKQKDKNDERLTKYQRYINLS